MEPMKDVIYGTMTPLSFRGIIDRIKFNCTAYDPGSRRYRLDFGLLFGAAIAALSLFGLAGLILREWIRSARAA
jgi:protein SCO1/2